MRIINTMAITQALKKLCMDANYDLTPDIEDRIRAMRREEVSPVGQDVLDQILTNIEIARREQTPMCQDTGTAVVFLEIGQDVHLEGPFIYDAVNEGVRQGYTEGYLRKSVVGHPLERKNTGDNTPAVIHTRFIKGDRVKITVAPKGGGAENMSRVKMLTPAEGIEGVKRFVLETVDQAGSNPCPPVVVGVGIGGTFEKCAILAKEALLRPIGQSHPDPGIARLEQELLAAVNRLGIGPQGLGGVTTALAVHVEIFPTHIASLPVAVNINCHASRHRSVEL